MFHCNVNLMRVVEKVCYSHFHCAEIAQLTIVSYQTITTESRRERDKKRNVVFFMLRNISLSCLKIFFLLPPSIKKCNYGIRAGN